MSNKICNFCKTGNPIQYESIHSFVELYKSYQYNYYPCCQYYKLEPFLKNDEISKLYEEDYEGFGEKGFFGKLKDFFTYIKIFQMKEFIQGKDILEIGSGTGQFLHTCKKFNPKSVEGIEISSYAVDYAKEHYKVDTIQTSLEEFKTKKKYDTIFMYHVIEHLTDPLNELKRIKQLLKPNGVLIMETPNWNSWEQIVYKTDWYGWQAPFHTYLFSPNALTTIVKKAGYKNAKVIHSPVPNSWIGSLKIKFQKKTFSAFKTLLLFAFFSPIAFVARLKKKSGRMVIQASL